LDVYARDPSNYDPAKVSCTVKVTVLEKTRDKKGKWSDTQIDVLQDCPVIFPSGGGFVFTFPLAAGDEGLVVFASRQIDNWWQSGKSSPRTDLRMHDLSDGFFIPGPFSNPKAAAVTGGGSTTAVQLRSLDGQTLFEFGPGKIQLIADEVYIHARLKASFDADGNGFVYQPNQIDTYTDGVPSNHHAPNRPRLPPGETPT
jgi:hypothetical protein